MGSFTEVVLAVRFLPDTPREVLGAFSDFADHDSMTGDALPTLETSIGPAKLQQVGLWEANDGSVESFLRMTPLEQAVLWRDLCSWGDTAYFPGSWTVSLKLRYQEYWTLTVRSYPKSTSKSVSLQLGPLGVFVGYPHQEKAEMVGYLKYEYEQRPVLIWSEGGRSFRFEDLNSPS